MHHTVWINPTWRYNWRTSQKRHKRRLSRISPETYNRHATMGVAQKLVAAVANLPAAVAQQVWLLGFIVAVGLTLVCARVLFMEMCPWLARHSHLATTAANLVIEYAWLMFQDVRLVFVSVEDAIHVISAGASPMKKFTLQPQPKKLSAAQVEHFLNTFPVMCHDFNWDLSHTLMWPARRLLSPITCPALRFLWPLQFSAPWVYTTGDTLLGWSSVDPNPLAGENNCHPDDDNMWVCVAFGTGYLVLELVVPAMIIVTFLLQPIGVLIQAAWDLTDDAFRLADKIVTRVVAGVESLGHLLLLIL